jgi:hypothetical protein
MSREGRHLGIVRRDGEIDGCQVRSGSPRVHESRADSTREWPHRHHASNDPLPPAEQVIVDWMLSVPRGVNLEAAARQQIALLDRRALLHPEVQYLRTLFVAIAGDCTWRGTFTHL